MPDYNSITALQGRYLGTIRTFGGDGGRTEDSYGGGSQIGGKRFVWNMYNRVLRHVGVIEGTNSWTYSTGSWRQVNATVGNKFEAVFGLAVEMFQVTIGLNIFSQSANASPGVGVDSTTANSAQMVGGQSMGTAGGEGSMIISKYYAYPIGYHAYNWLEYGGTTGTFYGDNGSVVQSAMIGLIAG